MKPHDGASAYPERWRKPPLIADWCTRLAVYGCAAIFLALCVGSVEVNWSPLYGGLDRGARFLSAFLQPNFVSRDAEILAGLMESLTMTVTATVARILVSIPIGLGVVCEEFISA